MDNDYYLGIDISKKNFQAALTQEGVDMEDGEVKNEAGAIKEYFKALKKRLGSFDKLIVCMEHTGIYCLPLLDYLVKNKINVCLEHALQIKQSQGMTRGNQTR